MHGRLKVRTSEEQAERKRLERERKLQAYQAGMSACFKLIHSKEYTRTGLKLTEDLLSANADLQTLWHYRKNSILSIESTPETNESVDLGDLLMREMSLTEQCLRRSPKSYCTWHHRQWCLLKSNQTGLGEKHPSLSWTNELSLCGAFLNADERNFHCWKHRFFVIQHGQLCKSAELDFTYEKICANFSNYSAWHYRSKLIEALYAPEQISAEVLAKELGLIENAVFTDPNDQSAWIYEKWFLLERQERIRLSAEQVEAHLRSVLELLELEGGKNKWCLLRAVELMCLVDFERYKHRVFEFLDRLADEIDTYRRNFYTDLKRSIQLKHGV
jgi:geranylgeranyl transferase type-2 subunit alpha